MDVNVVLVDGDMTFCDIADEPPMSAETGSDVQCKSFLESQMIWPSILPGVEQDLLRSQVYSALRSLGFTDGIFNAEARIIGSRFEWLSDKSGISKLAHTRHGDVDNQKDASAVLIEINARMPGYPGVNAVEHAHGIDYAALQLLLSVGDRYRSRLISHPFRGNADSCVVANWMSVDRGGRFLGNDMFEELATRRQDLNSWMVERLVYFEDGEHIPKPADGAAKWLALLTVRSELGRAHARRICTEIEGQVRYSITDE